MLKGAAPDSYAYLYPGDYVADTMHLTAVEHRALRLLLLEIWLRGRLPRANVVRSNIWPLLKRARPRIVESLKQLRSYDGRRLPSDVWDLVRIIVLERDGHTCVYCGAAKDLQGDHIVPLSRGGSNLFANLAAACRTCNQAKASRTAKEWRYAPPQRRTRYRYLRKLVQ
jgi:hypothetical protein